MHTGLINRQAPTSLREALDQGGHLWWVEDRINGLLPEDVKDNAFMAGFIGGLYNQVYKWAETEPAISRFTSRNTVTNLVNTLVAAKFATVVEPEVKAKRKG